MSDEKPRRAPRKRGNPLKSRWANGGPEASRKTERVTLRLPPADAAALRAYADREHAGNVSRAVAALIADTASPVTKAPNSGHAAA